MRLLILTTLLSSISMLPWGPSAAAQGIQTYERRFIGDIGYAQVDRRGNKIVVMNPVACQRYGRKLCSFFHAHEMAHHQLRHFDRNISVQQKEAEADRYAARVVSPAARNAAQQFFASGRGGSPYHGTSLQRMARVSSVSQSRQTSVAGTAATRVRTITHSNIGSRLGTPHSYRRNRILLTPSSGCR